MTTKPYSDDEIETLLAHFTRRRDELVEPPPRRLDFPDVLRIDQAMKAWHRDEREDPYVGPPPSTPALARYYLLIGHHSPENYDD